MQTTFSTPGIRAPDKEIGDDELLDTLKKLIDERTQASQHMKEMKESANLANIQKREALENTKKVKQQLNDTVVSS